MSEYQYYEWLALDRPLNDKQLSEVARLSSHMDTVTPTQAVVTYSWGDFKHDPIAVLAKYFDAFLYTSNWGTTRLAFRFPAQAIDKRSIESYLRDDDVTWSRQGAFAILEIRIDDENGAGEWVEAGGGGGIVGAHRAGAPADHRWRLSRLVSGLAGSDFALAQWR